MNNIVGRPTPTPFWRFWRFSSQTISKWRRSWLAWWWKVKKDRWKFSSHFLSHAINSLYKISLLARVYRVSFSRQPPHRRTSSRFDSFFVSSSSRTVPIVSGNAVSCGEKNETQTSQEERKNAFEIISSSHLVDVIALSRCWFCSNSPLMTPILHSRLIYF